MPRNNNYFPTLYQEIIFYTMYSRFDWDLKRRETWSETVERYFSHFRGYLKQHQNYTIPTQLEKELKESILNLSVIPSMRALATCGPAADRDGIAIYNCSYVPIDRPTSFDEIMFVLLNGTGVGYSVERQYVNKLPEVADEFHQSDICLKVPDSKLGWAKSFKELIHLLYGGQVPTWDLSQIRPKGAPLKTFGGRASGPEPLDDLFKFAVATFKAAEGRKLNSLECHDLVCKIGDVVVAGGVRRSALISLSNLSDDRMRHAKAGEWWNTHGHRRLANNSAAYTEKPDVGQFMREWLALYDSKSGERGIFNRWEANKTCERIGRREYENWEFGTNPCGEIILRPFEFCNLSAVVIRATDTLETLKEKVRLATILGTYQACVTNFRYVSKRWAQNCEEERLLGVSFTGIMDNELTHKGNLEETLTTLREVAIATNREFAKKLGINPSAAITCVKPSGNSSSLLDSASGIHPRYADYYIRRVRIDKTNPIANMLIDQGFPHEEDVMAPTTTWVFSFPIKSPKGCLTRTDLTAIEHLELWLQYKRYWCEHNPSITVYVKEHEWFEVGSWVYKHFDEIGGLTFLPHSDHTYRQAPYEEITELQYVELVDSLPEWLDWEALSKYEETDNTTVAQELACTAGACEIMHVA